MEVREKVIKFIKEQQAQRFRVIDNTGRDKKVIAGQFPDIIFLRQEPPPNSDILFLLKVENGGELIDSVPIWQALGHAPSVFYIVVPSRKLDEAKKLASATGVKAKFAWYEMSGEEVQQVYYE